LAVRTLEARESAALAGITEAAFATYNGHLHADPRLLTRRSTELYASWASRSCTDSTVADLVLGTEWHGMLAGFVTLKRGPERVWNVPLAAVAPDAQGRGILSTLLAAAIREVHARDGRVLEYGCVLTNIGAQKVLARLGFEIANSYHTLHKWFGD
jgi:ribosomal protein S18 acetylase RimI-like enzyme